MATHAIKSLFGASTAFAKTLAALASSIVGVGRQTTMVDNTVTRFGRLIIYIKITLGTNPTAGNVYVYPLRGDNHATPHRTDGAGASDAALTVLNALPIKVLRSKAAPATGDVLQAECFFDEPGPWFGLAIVHDTVVALDATEANHWLRYVGVDPEIQ